MGNNTVVKCLIMVSINVRMQKISLTIRTFAVTFLQKNAEENKAEILSYTQDSSKVVRDTLLTVLRYFVHYPYCCQLIPHLHFRQLIYYVYSD